jgi:methylase of polypeptide subunit release factors
MAEAFQTPSATTPDLERQDAAMLELLHCLKAQDYQFTSITPASHERVLARPPAASASLRDIFGWNRTFAKNDLDASLFRQLQESGLLAECPQGWRSEVRVSSLGSDLFLHSGFPTLEPDSVFFGPDTYRFARFIEEELGRPAPGAKIVDMGAGSGAGGLFCARLSPESFVTLVDVNEKALRLARLNAAAAEIEVNLQRRDNVPPDADVIVANPPYMIDPQRRNYRDGGGLLGGEIALEWVRQALGTLTPRGRLLLYSGVAVVEGKWPAIEAIVAECDRRGAGCTWREIDPDVFGEELSGPAYSEVERIAAVGVTIALPAAPLG